MNTTTPTFQEIDLAKLREELSEPNLAVLRPNWHQIIEAGIQVKLSVKYWRAKEQLSLDDFGFANATPAFRNFGDTYLGLGHKKLLPPKLLKQLHTLEQTARNTCRRYGVKSPHEHASYIILRKHYPTWRAKMLELQGQFQTLAEQIVDTRHEWVDELCQAYKEQVLTRTAVEKGVLPEFAEAAADPDSLERHLFALRQLVPPAEVIQERFYFDWDVSVVQKPTVLDLNQDVADLERRRESAERELAEMDELLKRRQLSAENDAEWQLQREKVKIEAERLRADAAIAEDMKRKEAETKARALEEVCTEWTMRARDAMWVLARSILKTADTKERIYPQQLQAMRETVKEIREFNIMGDAQIELIAEKVLAVSIPGADGYDLKAIREVWEGVHNWAHLGAELLHRPPRITQEEREDFTKSETQRMDKDVPTLLRQVRDWLAPEVPATAPAGAESFGDRIAREEAPELRRVLV